MRKMAGCRKSRTQCFYFIVFISLTAISTTAKAEDPAAGWAAVQSQTVANPRSQPVCEACLCELDPGQDSDGDLRISCEDALMRGELQLDSMQWPENLGEKRVLGSFEGLGWTTLEKVPSNDRVVYLSFHNNAIRTTYPGAFSDLPNLHHLYLSNNDLSKVTPDIFHNLGKLRQLDLSFNKLSEFNPLDFVELASLKTLNLKSNLITKIPIEALSKLPVLEQLDLSQNQLYFLDFGDVINPAYILKNLVYLDLSSNLLTVILQHTFNQAQKLEYLNLSKNNIASVDSGFLDDSTALLQLDLSENQLKTLGNLPASLQELSLQHNSFSSWPTLPENLKNLDLSKNSLVEVYSENQITFNYLQRLNVSSNILSAFEILRSVPELQILDISYNVLQDIPASLSAVNFPKLQELYVDGNPMKKLKFISEIKLGKLSANYLGEVISLDASSFAKLHGRVISGTVEPFEESECMDISISHCEKLEIIHDNSFQGIKLCHLNLSNNKLTTLSENVADWKTLKGGVNLQNNPWDCQCPLQWLLDDLLMDLYTNHPVYLHELRCESPRAVQGLRLVHWYKNGDKAFCGADLNADGSSNYFLMPTTDRKESGGGILMGSGAATIAILVCIIAGLIAVVALIVYLVRGKYRHNYQVRRQMMKKRQEMTDAKKLNVIGREQNEVLNAA